MEIHQNKAWLYKKYIEEQLSTLEISKMTNVHREAIRRQLIKFNIPRRTLPEAQRLMSRANDLRGRRFGRLTAFYDSGKRSDAGYVIWTCLCICGNLTEVVSDSLISGKTKSCGCLRQESARRNGYKHGEAGKYLRIRTRLYGIWCGMKTRCGWLSAKDYKYYGGRGIKVCDEWKKNFIAFRGWALINGYQEHLTIDRKNNDGDYEPNNCQWITISENSKKRWQSTEVEEKEEDK